MPGSLVCPNRYMIAQPLSMVNGFLVHLHNFYSFSKYFLFTLYKFPS